MNRAQNDTTNLAQTHANASNAHNVKLVLSEEGNQLLCAVALKCLAVVVLVSGTFLKPVMHKLLQEHIVKQSIQMVTTTQSKTQLYGLAECRSLLYRLLHVLVTAAHHLSPPPLQFAVEVLSIGAVRDASPNVRKDCVQFVRSLEKILHPQKETLQFAAELGEVQDAVKELRQLKEKLTPQDKEDESDDEDEVGFEMFFFCKLFKHLFRILDSYASNERKSCCNCRADGSVGKLNCRKRIHQFR